MMVEKRSLMFLWCVFCNTITGLIIDQCKSVVMNLCLVFTFVIGVTNCQIQSNFINWRVEEDKYNDLDYDDDYDDGNYDDDYDDYANNDILDDDSPGKYLATIMVKR